MEAADHKQPSSAEAGKSGALASGDKLVKEKAGHGAAAKGVEKLSPPVADHKQPSSAEAGKSGALASGDKPVKEAAGHGAAAKGVEKLSPPVVKQDGANEPDEEEAGHEGDQKESSSAEAGKGGALASEDKPESAEAGKSGPVKEAESEEPPFLGVDAISNIVARLPSEQAACCALLSRELDLRIKQTFFLKNHLMSGSCDRSFNEDDTPNVLLLKPTAVHSDGYTHLTLMNMGTRRPYEELVVRTEGGDFHLFTDPYQPPLPTAGRFFFHTVPKLDLSVKAAEGRLLLGHSGRHRCFFLCNPTQDRIIRLPATPLEACGTLAALSYQMGSCGEMNNFAVVLLAALPDEPGKIAFQSFSSDECTWEVTEKVDPEIASVVAGVLSPGVYSSEKRMFCWISRETGAIVAYDHTDGRTEVIPPPPAETEAHPISKGWALGSTGGRLRLSNFSVGPEANVGGFHRIDVPGVLCVWSMVGDGVWASVRQINTPVIWMLHGFIHLEARPLDVARADPSYMLVLKDRAIRVRSLEEEPGEGGNGGAVLLSDLYRNRDAGLHAMYHSCDTFYIYH